MVEKLELVVFDTEATARQLVRVVKSLHNRSEWRADSWWTVVEEYFDEAPNVFGIRQTN